MARKRTAKPSKNDIKTSPVQETQDTSSKQFDRGIAFGQDRNAFFTGKTIEFDRLAYQDRFPLRFDAVSSQNDPDIMEIPPDFPTDTDLFEVPNDYDRIMTTTNRARIMDVASQDIKDISKIPNIALSERLWVTIATGASRNVITDSSWFVSNLRNADDKPVYERFRTGSALFGHAYGTDIIAKAIYDPLAKENILNPCLLPESGLALIGGSLVWEATNEQFAMKNMGESRIQVNMFQFQPLSSIRELKLDSACLGEVNGADILKAVHQRGHVSPELLLDRIRNYTGDVVLIQGLHASKKKFNGVQASDVQCPACQAVNLLPNAFEAPERRAVRKGEILHVDLSIPMTTRSINGETNVLVVVDDYTNYIWTYFTKGPTDLKIFQKIYPLICEIEQQFNTKVRSLRTDHDIDFANHLMGHFLKLTNRTEPYPFPHIHQKNGVAEYYIRLLFALSRTYELDSGIPSVLLWPYVLEYAAYVSNWLIPRQHPDLPELTKTAGELLTGSKPSFTNFYAFGSDCWIHLSDGSELAESDRKGHRGIYLRPLHPGLGILAFNIDTLKVVKSTVPRVNDRCFSHVKAFNSMLKDAELDLDTNTSFPSVEDVLASFCDMDKTALTMQTTVTKNPQKDIYGHAVHEMWRHLIDSRKPLIALKLLPSDVPIPLSPDEALSCELAHYWKCAMWMEINNLIAREAIERSDGSTTKKKALPARWVMSRKINRDGFVVKLEARLVIQGYDTEYEKQASDITWTPVHVRLALALATTMDMQIHHVNIHQNAPLYSELEEDVYFTIDGERSKLKHKLKKTIHGFHEGPKNIYLRFQQLMKNQKFKSYSKDSNIYMASLSNKLVFIAYCGGDILIMSGHTDIVKHMKTQIERHFAMKDFGHPHVFRDINVDQDLQKGTTSISAKLYIQKILVKYGLDDIKTQPIPLPTTTKFDAKGIALGPEKIKLYRQLVHEIFRLSTMVRPDICYAYQQVQQHVNQPNEYHLEMVYQIIGYLKLTMDRKLVYRKDSANFEAFSHSQQSANDELNNYVIGGLVNYAGAPVDWISIPMTRGKKGYVRKAALKTLFETSSRILGAINLYKFLGPVQHGPIIIYDTQVDTIGTIEPDEAEALKLVSSVNEIMADNQMSVSGKLPDKLLRLPEIWTRPLPEKLFENLCTRAGMPVIHDDRYFIL